MARIILFLCAVATATALAPRDGSDGTLAERLERLERGLWPVVQVPPRTNVPFRIARLNQLVRGGHGQTAHWFKDLMPLVDCEGEQACSARALGHVTHKSDLWSMPGMPAIVELVRSNATFAAEVPCAEPSAAAFQDAVDALSAVPTIAFVPGGQPPRRERGAPLIALSPRASETLGGLEKLLQAPMAALDARAPFTLNLEVDVDDSWFVPGRRSADVNAIHLVGQGRIILNPRFAAKLGAHAAAGTGPSPIPATPSLHPLRSCALACSTPRSCALALNPALRPPLFLRPGNSVLNSTYAALTRALSKEPAPGAAPASTGAAVRGMSAREEGLLEVLHAIVFEQVGDTALELPWKCFVCVVSLSMLVPLAVNLALQAVVSVFCAAAHVPDDDCIAYRYDMLALGVLVPPKPET